MNSLDFIQSSYPVLLEPGDMDVLNRSIQITASISVIGCLCNLFLIFYEGIHKKPIMKALIALCFTDLTANITGLVTTFPKTHESTCTALSFFMAFGFVGSVLFTCCISHSYKVLRLSSSYESWVKKTSSLIYSYLIISFSGTFLFAILATIGRTLRLSESKYCSHYGKPDGIFETCVFTALMVGLPILSICYCLYCYYAIVKAAGLKKAGRYVLFFYPLILIFCFLPLGISELMRNFSDGTKPFSPLLVSISMYLQGILNSLVYGIFSAIYRRCCLNRQIKDPLIANAENSYSSSELESERKFSLA